jgi:hypothetical protein
MGIITLKFYFNSADNVQHKQTEMKKKILLAALTFFVFTAGIKAQGNTGIKTYRVGIFSPLYLDSIFAGSYYRYGKAFPKFAQMGLDFVQGAEIALDSIPLPNGNIHAEIFDSKASSQNIQWLIANHRLDSLDLLIGAVKDIEFTQLASFAKQKNIPFISAVLPNDGGVTSNPFLVVVNSTLRAHCETIYSYLLQNHGTDNIILCRKKGGQEDKIADYLKNINEPDGKPVLPIRIINFDNDFSILKSKLDSTKKTVIIGGSLNESFAESLIEAAYQLKNNYQVEMIGMPNWDGFSAARKSTYKDFSILFTTPYLNTKSDFFSRKIQNVYSRRYKGVPSDMSYRGFETVFVFSRLITRYPDDFMSHLNDYAYKVFNDYNFKPVYLNKQNDVPDYFENKHLYFMRIMNGKVSKAW